MNAPSRFLRSVMIVVNGKAEARAQLAVAEVVEGLVAKGRRAEVRTTSGAGDDTRFAALAGELGFDCVAAVGGDGTISGVVHGVLTLPAERRPSVAFVPLGTANDFARGCRWTSLDPAEALRTALDFPVTMIDAGKVVVEREDADWDPETAWRPLPVSEASAPARRVEFANDVAPKADRTFINVATAGAAAETTTGVDDETKDFLGPLAYLFSGLSYATTVQPWSARVTGPGFEWSGSIYALFVGNNRTAGGGFQLCPDALLNDGLLDVAVIPEMPFNELLELTGTLLGGGTVLSHPAVQYRQLNWLEIDCPTGLQVNLDGEPVRGVHFRFESMPKAISFHLPPEAPLVGAAPRAN